jgi:L-fucose mutarotase/ribose pyranase (RbsD/FucU family)
MQAIIDRVERRPVAMLTLKRFEFYPAAKRAFAITRTADSGPHGRFILKKGVVTLPPLS